LSALHQRWANITAAVIQTGCTIATLGAAAAGAGYAALAGVVAGSAAIGSISVVATAIPANKGLNIARKVIGMVEMTISVAAGALSLLSFSFAGEEAGIADLEMIKIPFQRVVNKRVSNLPSGLISVNDSVEQLLLEVTEPDPDFAPITQMDILLAYAPDGRLKFMSVDETSQAWLYLRHSPIGENIMCDTGTILLAYTLVRKPLPVADLDEFLSVRYESIQYYYDVDLRIKRYLTALKKILTPLQRGCCQIGIFGLQDVFYQVNRATGVGYAVISDNEHITVLFNHPGTSTRNSVFGIYTFDDESGIEFCEGFRIHDIRQMFYKNWQSTVIFYMQLDV